MSRWTAFSGDQVADLGRQVAATGLDGRTCPNCGQTAIRYYRYASSRTTGPTTISYTWCSNCHRFSGSTGPRRADVVMNDPPPAQLDDSGKDALTALLDYAEGLWDAGRLPAR